MVFNVSKEERQSQREFVTHAKFTFENFVAKRNNTLNCKRKIMEL